MKAEIVDIDEIQEIIMAFATGDFSRRLSMSELLDERDIIVSGINMLGEELQKKTVSRNYFSGIFNSIPELLIVLDKFGNIQNINESGKLAVGFELLEDLIGKSLTQIFSPTINKQFTQFLKSGKQSVSFETELKKITKYNFPALCSFSKLNDPANNLYLFFAQDLTEKKKEDLRILKATINGQEGERRRLANDLHDSLGQELNAVKMYINAIEKMDSTSDLYKKSIRDVHGLLDLTIESIREISFGLMPAVLMKDSLNVSLIQLFNRINSVQSIPVYYTIPQNPLIFKEKNDELFMYRIIQEFLNNSIKYSKAAKITVNISVSPKGKFKIFNLSDDGIGFDFKKVKSNNGLNNIIYRLQALGSEFEFVSQPKKGTALSIKLYE